MLIFTQGFDNDQSSDEKGKFTGNGVLAFICSPTFASNMSYGSTTAGNATLIDY